jgi:hypothetical protein
VVLVLRDAHLLPQLEIGLLLLMQKVLAFSLNLYNLTICIVFNLALDGLMFLDTVFCNFFQLEYQMLADLLLLISSEHLSLPL